MIQQSLVVGGRGNASVITLPFRPREPLSLPYLFACSAYIRTNSPNSTTNAMVLGTKTTVVFGFITLRWPLISQA